MNNRLRHLEKRPNHMDEKESIDIQQYHPGRIHFIFILYKIWNILSVSREAFQKSLTFQYSYSVWRKIINHEMSKPPTLQKLMKWEKKFMRSDDHSLYFSSPGCFLTMKDTGVYIVLLKRGSKDIWKSSERSNFPGSGQPEFTPVDHLAVLYTPSHSHTRPFTPITLCCHV